MHIDKHFCEKTNYHQRFENIDKAGVSIEHNWELNYKWYTIKTQFNWKPGLKTATTLQY